MTTVLGFDIPDRALRVRDVALLLDVSERTVRRYIAAGLIPAARTPTGLVRIAGKALQQALDACDADRRAKLGHSSGPQTDAVTG